MSHASAPTLHIRPRRGWLNDPNGMTRHRGRWHVFFQHNPARARHGDIHWGHVSSPDLLRWTEHPVAFGPQPGGPDRGGCWSGSFLGWGDRPAVAYTGILDGPQDSTVCVRHALDDALETWSDPVVVARQPAGAGVLQMRDPYPFEWNGRRFALLGAGSADRTPSVLLFSCDDPRAWRFEGSWLSGRDGLAATVAPAEIWECPQLLRFGDSYVLVLSLLTDGRLEDVVYLVGAMVDDPAAAGRPLFVARSGGLLDRGPDFYAPQVVDDGGPDPLLLGWVRQHDAPDDAPDDAVAGCLTFPRRLALAGAQIQVSPDPALDALVGRPVPAPPGDGRPILLPARAKVSIRPPAGSTLRLDLLAADARVPVAVDERGCDIWLDGEVAELYRPGTVAGTIRRPGTAAWSLARPADPSVVTVRELALPDPVG